ncbi:MAG TPA: HAMP domain-containing sensor histidine kinase [Anaerolineae bacterium]|nr:HAMP domain-containing sensor histidine kinase [Anaerolineae bacterium]HPL28685.1 HAMP domain-containing sensor histidine kinase [Anaerolineae bacterium]
MDWLLVAAVGVLALALGGLLCRSELQRRTRWLALALVAAWAVGAALAALGQGRAGLPLQALAFAWSAALLAWLPRREAGSRAEIARLRAIAEARAERVSVLSHEVRTPLAMIKAAADLLLEGKPGPLTPQQATFLETISQNCERTIGLAEDLLTQARIEAGLFKVNLQPVDLCGLVRQLARGLRPLLERQGQIMVLDCPQVMPRIQADPRLIQQALTNLLHNASRYTSPGGHIYVNISDNGHTVVVAVTDDGAGMSAEERRRLFQRFSSSRPLGDGTGLGLLIVKQIVELHGGRIMVDTNLGRGTTFLFTLPRLTAEEGAERELKELGD